MKSLKFLLLPLLLLALGISTPVLADTYYSRSPSGQLYAGDSVNFYFSGLSPNYCQLWHETTLVWYYQGNCPGVVTYTVEAGNYLVKGLVGNNWTEFETFTVLSVTPTPTPTPTPSPTPIPPPSESELLQSILSELQTIGGVISSILAKLTTIISSIANLATENTLGLIKVKTDKLTFDSGNNLNITGTTSSNWETGTSLGHGFIVTTDDITLRPKSETAVLLIKNPSGSGKTMRLNKILAGASDKTSAILRVYLDPTVTSSGTNLVVNGLKSGNISAMQAFQLPTVSEKGTELDSARYASAGREIDYGLGLYIQPGESILLTIQLDSHDSGDTLSVTWLEE